MSGQYQDIDVTEPFANDRDEGRIIYEAMLALEEVLEECDLTHMEKIRISATMNMLRGLQ